MHPELPFVSSVTLITGFTVQGKDDALLGTLRGFAFVSGALVINATTGNDLSAPCDAAAGLSSIHDLTGQDVRGPDLRAMKLATNFYSFSSDDQLTEAITPDDERNPDAPFVLQIGKVFTLKTASSLATINGGAMPGWTVSWQVQNSAMLETGMVFEGPIAGSNIATWDSDTTLLDDSALAITEPVTLQAGTLPNCIADDCSAVAVPNSAALCLGLLPVGWLHRKGRTGDEDHIVAGCSPVSGGLHADGLFRFHALSI